MPADATIIVVYQNSMPYLAVCLEALARRRNRATADVLLVENPCVDDSGAAARAFAAADPARRRVILNHDPPVPGRGGGANHGHGLSAAFREVRTPWTVFLDADCFVMRDGWLDDLLAVNADIVGSPAFGWLKDLSMVHAHPCLLAFKSKVARPPYWNGDFNLWRRAEHPDVIKDDPWWDTAIAFTHCVGSRPDVRLVRLPMEEELYKGLLYYWIADLAIHLCGTSNLAMRGDAIRKVSKLALLEMPELAGLVPPPPPPTLEILTRTHRRPMLFARCRESVEKARAAFPGRIVHHILCDDEESLAYCTGDLVTQVEPRPDADYGPNDYYAQARGRFTPGAWILHLDDDDLALDLAPLAAHMGDTRNLILWQVNIAGRLYPVDRPRRPERGSVSGIGFAVHRSEWVPWPTMQAGDWRVLGQLWPKCRIEWIPRVLTAAQGEPGHRLTEEQLRLRERHLREAAESQIGREKAFADV